MTAGDPVLVDSAPSERAPAPVPVEWGIRDGAYDTGSRAEVERTVEKLRELGSDARIVAHVPAADYDRMEKALALLARADLVTLEALRDGLVDADHFTSQRALITVIAAVKAARATQEGT